MKLEFYKNPPKQNKVVKFIKGCGPNGIGVISFFGCNLKCFFCFAQKYSYNLEDFQIDTGGRVDIDTEDFSEYVFQFLIDYPSICYIQLTGGEPLLNNSRIDRTVDALRMLDLKVQNKVRLIYQTNGIFLGRKGEQLKSLENLRSLNNIKILFELSIKGTNEREFYYLSGYNDGSFLGNQLKAYWILKDLKSENIEVVARLGTGHHKKTIHFIDPETTESMFLRKNWDPRFQEIFLDTTKRFGKTKMVAECINAEGDGSWPNYLYRSIPAIARCLREKLLVSRAYSSKAINKAIDEYGGIIDEIRSIAVGFNRMKLREDYDDFLGNFDPMADPAHAYCGRDEFRTDQRGTCNPSCSYL